MEYIALFDLDGVILDTESQYTVLWNRIGEKYGKVRDFGIAIKGQTLEWILNEHFSAADRRDVIGYLDDFEENMNYDYVPGAEEFIDSLRETGIRCAVVTSSNRVKMDNVYRHHPDFKEKFDYILTSEDFTQSKPSPECFLKGMRKLGSDAGHTVIFEDSVNGLKAARSSGARVVGLTTSNDAETVGKYADIVIGNFVGHTFGEFLKNPKNISAY
ncbi:MAG: HAD family hydrolase [Candidatus Cryptobacteroides sp.]